MRKAELLRRIEELERRLAAAEQRLAAMPMAWAPAQPFIGPTMLPQPLVVPNPVWPTYDPRWPIVTCVGGVITAEPPLCPYPIGEDRALAGQVDWPAAVPLCPDGAATSFVAHAGVYPRTVCGTAIAQAVGPAMCIGAASASRH